MKTLLVTYDFPPIVSGIGTFLYETWKRLPGQDTVILAPAFDGYKNCDAALHCTIRRYFSIGPAVMRVLLLLPYVGYVIVRGKIDILVCSVPVSIGWLGFLFKKLWGIRYYVFYYGGESAKFRRRPWVLKALRAVLANADGIIVNSGYTRQEVCDFQISAEKISVITPGVDSDFFLPGLDSSGLKEKLGVRKDAKIILTVARLVRRKGVDAVIRVLRSLRQAEPQAVYVVVGAGPQARELKRLAVDEGVSDAVVFVGAVAQEELPIYYNLCNVFVMPNRELPDEDNLEGFGISFIEASACAKPVVGGVTGGVRDAVIDGQTGLLVDPECPHELEKALIRLLQDSSYAQGLGNNGRRRVEQEFTWESRSAALEALFSRGVKA